MGNWKSRYYRTCLVEIPEKDIEHEEIYPLIYGLWRRWGVSTENRHTGKVNIFLE